MKLESIKEKFYSPNLLLGVFIVLGFAVFGFFIKSAMSDIAIRTNANGITVSGTAQRIVMSDSGNIKLKFTIDNANIQDQNAMKVLTDARNAFIEYLSVNDNIDKRKIEISPIIATENCTKKDKDYNCIGIKYESYDFDMSITSDDVDKISDLSMNIATKISDSNLSKYFENISITTDNPKFFYGQFDNIKSQMLNEATRNAFERADSIAKSTNNRAGEVITASQGVFQVTTKDAVDLSDYGMYDTSSIEKKIKAVVRVSFKVK